jgi:hypothetical protein
MKTYLFRILALFIATSCWNKPDTETNQHPKIKTDQAENVFNQTNQESETQRKMDSNYVALFENGLKVIYARSFENRQINFLYHDSLLHSTKFPSQEEVSGISMNYVRNEDNKLVISFDYGSVNYFDKTLYFRVGKEEKTFTLYRVKESTFNKGNTENVKHTDTILKNKIRLQDFELVDFID